MIRTETDLNSAEQESLAWHRHQVAWQYARRNDERGNGTDGHRYAWRAVLGLRSELERLGINRRTKSIAADSGRSIDAAALSR